MLNKKSIDSLIYKCSSSKDMLDIVYDALISFEEYHNKIYNMETKIKLYSVASIGREEYQSMVSELDKTRTIYHDTVLTNLNVLNRLAAKLEIEPVYDGVVSREHPHRRIAANAVMEYIADVINNRR